MATQFGPAIAALVERLVAEGILVAGNDHDGIPPADLRPPRYPRGIPYLPPQLERFEDVRDLLLIDPIHQVDPELGWPRKNGQEG